MIDILYRRPSSSLSSHSLASSGISWLRPATNIPPSLAFDRIVDGKTCFPCRLQDFMNYLHFVEHNAEYLKFYLWYRDYKKRFYSLPHSEMELSPPWEAATANIIPTLRKRAEDTEYICPSSSDGERKMSAFWRESGDDGDDRRANRERKDSSVVKVRSEAEKVALQAMADAHFDKLEEGETLLPFTIQPYRSEIAQMCSLFLTSGGALELNLSSRDRQATLQALNRTTHPSALQPVIRAAESALRSHSHPNFTRRVVSNSNPDRAASLNYIGYVLLVLSIAGCIILTLSHKPRAWRVLPCFGIAVAVGHIVSGVRGFCCRLFVSGFKRNLEPWQAYTEFDELNHHDEESKPTHSPSSSVFDFNFDEEAARRAEENVERFKGESSLRHMTERGVTVIEPGLRKLHWNMFWQIFFGGWLTLAVSCAVFVPIPKGNSF